MKFEQHECGLALKSKKRGILGWVMASTNGQFTFDVSRKQTKGAPNLFDTIEEAKAALIEVA